MGEALAPVVLDAGALVAVERGTKRMKIIVRRAADTGGSLVVPAPVLAQVWRGGARQALLARFVNLPFVEVDLLTRATWRAAGVLCGVSGTRDVVDAAVVVCAHERSARVVITSDPEDLARLEAHLDGSLDLRVP